MPDTLPLLPILAAVLGAYLCGSIPFGLIFGRLKGLDIRQHGSGNIGATNVLRVLGKKWGIPCFLLDFLKGLLPVLALRWLCRDMEDSGWTCALPLTAAVCATLGHIFSCWVSFKGGKGVATSAGAILGLAPFAVLVAFVIWYVVFRLSGYVSLASIAAAIALPLSGAVGWLLGWAHFAHNLAEAVFFALMGAGVIWMHRTNIARLRAGTESSFKKKAPEGPP